MKNFCDFSQYSTFQRCQWLWYERYIRQTVKERPAQRDDPLTLGGCVHAGLEHLSRYGLVEIPQAAIIELSPTAECAQWARALVQGYAQTYPEEQFQLQTCEAPLRFPAHYAMDGLAKIDKYFYVDAPTAVPSGLGADLWLNPGWWIYEYKTKDASRNTGNWIEQWKVCKQADFQILALQAHLSEPVQGVLVNVLEKPKLYVPKHKCKECQETSERSDWLPVEELWVCPKCGNRQPLTFAKRSDALPQPTYYRILVQRSSAALERSWNEIVQVADLMHRLAKPEVAPAVPLMSTETHCVHSIFGRCEYFSPHSEGREAAGWQSGDEKFVQIDAYAYVKEQNEA